MKTIDTVQGVAIFVRTEIEDKNGYWNDNYNTKDGYYVIHRYKAHDVYRVTK